MKDKKDPQTREKTAPGKVSKVGVVQVGKQGPRPRRAQFSGDAVQGWCGLFARADEQRKSPGGFWENVGSKQGVAPPESSAGSLRAGHYCTPAPMPPE